MADGREKLRAWTLADELVLDLYAMTKRPAGEAPEDLLAALRATAVRAALRIVQGVHGRNEEFASSLRHALGALAEVRYYLYLARRLGLIDLRRYRGACARHEKAQKCLRDLLSNEDSGSGAAGSSPSGGRASRDLAPARGGELQMTETTLFATIDRESALS